jgi:Ca2+-binding EF-hand superfamily protein
VSGIDAVEMLFYDGEGSDMGSPSSASSSPYSLAAHASSQYHLLHPLVRRLVDACPDSVVLEIALTMLLPGNKSSKLSRTFLLLYRQAREGLANISSNDLSSLPPLPPSLLGKMVLGYLHVIQLLIPLDSTSHPWLLQQVQGAAVSMLTANNQQGLTFDELGNWYNMGGYKLLPWMELLDIAKWRVPSCEYDDEAPQDITALFGLSSPASPSILSYTQTSTATTSPATSLVTFSFPSTNPLIRELTLHVTRQVVLDALDTKQRLDRLNITPNMSKCAIASKLSSSEAGNSVLDCYSALTAQEQEVDYRVGLFFFMDGNKSAKLGEAFDVFVSGTRAYSDDSDDSDDSLTPYDLMRFIRSYLTSLAALAHSRLPYKNYTNQLYNAITTASKWTAELVLEYTKSGGHTGDTVSFEWFASWYTEGEGYKYAPWLELVDLRKFVGLVKGKEDEDEEEDCDDEDYDDDGGGGYEDEDVKASNRRDYYDGGNASDGAASYAAAQGIVFTFPLTIPDGDEAPKSLYVTQHDVAFVRVLVSATELDKVPPEALCEKIMLVARWDTRIDQDAVCGALDSLVQQVNGSGLDPEVTAVFKNIFSRFPDSSSSLSVAAVIGGLTLFCGGDKSSKLAFLFDLFDESSNGYLTPDETYTFLSSILTTVMSCTSQGLMMAATDASETVDEICAKLTDMLLDFTHPNGRSGVSFDDFGAWYNGGGFEYAPWLELLALNKWTNPPSTSQRDSDDEGGEKEEEEEEDDDDDDDEYMFNEGKQQHYSQEDNELAVNSWVMVNNSTAPSYAVRQSLNFTVKNNSAEGGVEVTYSPAAIRAVNELVSATGLCTMPFRDVCEKLIAAADHGSLSKFAFDECIREMIPADRMKPETRLRLSATLSRMFYAFDRDGTATVNVLEFASGFSVFCEGKKSDKLAFAFETMDDDLDGKLSRRAMWRFARAFLTVLVKIGGSSSADEGLEDEEDFINAVDSGAVWTAASIFVDVDGKGVLFDDFAEWYTKGGFRDNSWLELLDLRKWCM